LQPITDQSEKQKYFVFRIERRRKIEHRDKSKGKVPSLGLGIGYSVSSLKHLKLVAIQKKGT